MDMNHPMGAARYVRKECYAWPGGYPLALVMDDGGLLCPACVASEFSRISWSHRNACSDGFRPSGILCGADTDSEMRCDHCYKIMQEEAGVDD